MSTVNSQITLYKVAEIQVDRWQEEQAACALYQNNQDFKDGKGRIEIHTLGMSISLVEKAIPPTQ